jgi:hypothetical protein
MFDDDELQAEVRARRLAENLHRARRVDRGIERMSDAEAEELFDQIDEDLEWAQALVARVGADVLVEEIEREEPRG